MVKATLKIVDQAANAKASTLYMFNNEDSTSNTVNAEAIDTNTSTFYMVLTDQVANARITSSLVNVQTSTSYTADLEANALYKNAVYDETSFSCESAVYNEASPSCDNANAEKVKNIGEMQYDFSLLKVGYTFDSWDDVDSYFKAYGQYSGFVVIKKQVEQRNDGVIRHRSFGCEFGEKYVPKKSIDINIHRREVLNDIEFYTKNRNLSITIQHQLLRAKYPDATFLDADLANAIQHYKIKSKDLKTDASQLLSFLIKRCSEESGWSIEFEYNNIIKRQLHSKGSLCELLKTLDSRLKKKAEWNRFFEYKTLLSCVGIASVGSKVLPAVNHILSEYLTLQILSIERIEMAQCLYFNVTLANLAMLIRLDSENESIGNQFIEDIYDVRQILLKSMVSEVDHVNIKETWQITNKRPGNNQRKHFIIVMLVSQISGFHIGMVASCWYYDHKKKTIDQANVIFAHSDAITTNNLCAAAWHSKFGKIWSFARQAVQLAVECEDNKIKQWLKSFINQKKHFLAQNEEPKDSEKENNSTIVNPLITRCKGRPETKQYKAATEKGCRQPYTCRSCSKTEHNSARCQEKDS
ncbi:16132_t:CDS:2 [Cetraspora pellucida]|uniref:16132_t:CDS:1 n=1 Tax=Cetraspora pellucida TaxID=1433469 RepID=A0ACA9K099_9GLOM|nr:16132_t:CDS:2 [Cetraspora pellucida]